MALNSRISIFEAILERIDRVAKNKPNRIKAASSYQNRQNRLLMEQVFRTFRILLPRPTIKAAKTMIYA
ncbi:hypothetical protein [Acetobacter sp. P5B1]|uniref:hypothetical protein n=1 Tax=Acetobacter sp. P5B1 TaxID=2762620 RepID=UPI001C03F0B7|nr:hypothetical protein [Acetobacter sp. P5B1]